MIDALGDKDSRPMTFQRHDILISIQRSFDQEAQRPGNGVTMNYRGAENGARRFSATDRYLLHELANVYQESITLCIIDASFGRTPVSCRSYPLPKSRRIFILQKQRKYRDKFMDIFLTNERFESSQ